MSDDKYRTNCELPKAPRWKPRHEAHPDFIEDKILKIRKENEEAERERKRVEAQRNLKRKEREAEDRRKQEEKRQKDFVDGFIHDVYATFALDVDRVKDKPRTLQPVGSDLIFIVSNDYESVKLHGSEHSKIPVRKLKENEYISSGWICHDYVYDNGFGYTRKKTRSIEKAYEERNMTLYRNGKFTKLMYTLVVVPFPLNMDFDDDEEDKKPIAKNKIFIALGVICFALGIPTLGILMT